MKKYGMVLGILMFFSVFLIDNFHMDALCLEWNGVKRFLCLPSCLLMCLLFHAAFAYAMTALDLLAWDFLVADKNKWTLGDAMLFNAFLPYKRIFGLLIFALAYNMERNRDRVKRIISHGAADAFACLDVHESVPYRHVVFKTAGW